MVRPEDDHSVVRGVGSAVVAARRTLTVLPVASAICEATVRFQIRS
jgi:hypothetical protein